jgi:xanthine dehydrogenase accessory factor
MAPAEPIRVAVYGGGELGTAAAHRLRRAGLAPFVVELARPTAVCRAVCAAYAVYAGALTVEGVGFDVAAGAIFAESMMARGLVPLLAQPTANMMERLAPRVYVDATFPRTARLPFEAPKGVPAVAVGAWRLAGREVQATVDTRPLASLGSVLDGGGIQEVAHDAGAFLPVRGVTAPREGVFAAYVQIGDAVSAGQPLGVLQGEEIAGPVDGHVRGLLADGVTAAAGQSLAEIDLSGDPANCFAVSAWARAVAGGVLEAVVRLTR